MVFTSPYHYFYPVSHFETQMGSTTFNGHLASHIRALIIATAEPGNCPREPFLLPLKGHNQGRWNQGGALAPQ